MKTIGALVAGRADMFSLAPQQSVREAARYMTERRVGAVCVLALLHTAALPRLIDLAMPWPLTARLLAAAAILIPTGVLLGVPLPAGMRLVAARRPDIVPWGWGLNGAFSVVGATLAVFAAMNWGFSTTLSICALVYAAAAQTLRVAASTD